MTVLLDSDVLLDVALARPQFVADSRAVLDWCELHPGSGCIAWHSTANIYYLLRRDRGDGPARRFIHDSLDFLEIVAAGTAQAKHALMMPMQDFEDALQAAAAVLAGADYIITRNIADYHSSPVVAIQPAAFIGIAPA